MLSFLQKYLNTEMQKNFERSNKRHPLEKKIHVEENFFDYKYIAMRLLITA